MKRILTEKERALFTAYIAGLEAAGIPHAIARNHEGFPFQIGNDVDLMIPRGRRHEASALFREVLAEHRGTIWKENPREYLLDFRFSLPDSATPLHLDVFWGVFTWHGLPYVDESLALQEAEVFPGYRAVRPAHEIMGMYCSSLLWGSFYNSKYGPRLRVVMADPNERAAFDACFADVFGPGAPPIVPGADPEPSAHEGRAAGHALRSRLKKRCLWKSPVGTLIDRVRYFFSEISTVLRPTGLCIAILGPDGSGKSSVLAMLAQKLLPLFEKLRAFHWRPGVLPDAGVAAGHRQQEIGVVKDPHAHPPHSAPVAFARLCWYACDYWLGHLLKVRKGLAQSDLILFDRHAADILCDPRRYRFGLPRWLLGAFVAMLPKPQLTFVLISDARTIARRKGEIPEENVGQLLENYRNFAARGGTVRGVDATRPLDEVVADIEQQVLEHMKARLK